MKRLIFIVCVLLVTIISATLLDKDTQCAFGATTTENTYGNSIIYLCADWGPDLENPDKEKIYCIKEIIFFENKKYLGYTLWLSSMNPDGTDKKDIAKLIEDNSEPISGDSNNFNMDICYKTKQAVIAFASGQISQTGLWTVNLDGTGFKRIVEQDRGKDFKVRVNHPSWFLNGEYLVYKEKFVKEGKWSDFYIVKVDKEGKNKTYLTSKDDGGTKNQYPAVSPDGTKIVYANFPDHPKNFASDLCLMDQDGKNKRLLHKNITRYTEYPEWSPDGQQIYFMDSTSTFVFIVGENGKKILSRQLKIDGKIIFPTTMHWSNYGYLLDNEGKIRLIEPYENWKSDEKLLDYQVYANYLLVQKKAYIETENKKDLLKQKYRWGGVTHDKKD